MSTVTTDPPGDRATGLWPLPGWVFLFVMFAKVIPGLNATTNIVGLGAVAIGLVPMVIYRAKRRPYFARVSASEPLAPAG